MSYTDLAREADRVAAALIALGIGKGVRVGLLMPNWPEWLATAFGIVISIAVVTTRRKLTRSRPDDAGKCIGAAVSSDRKAARGGAISWTTSSSLTTQVRRHKMRMSRWRGG